MLCDPLKNEWIVLTNSSRNHVFLEWGFISIFRCISRTYPGRSVDRSITLKDFYSVGVLSPFRLVTFQRNNKKAKKNSLRIQREHWFKNSKVYFSLLLRTRLTRKSKSKSKWVDETDNIHTSQFHQPTCLQTQSLGEGGRVKREIGKASSEDQTFPPTWSLLLPAGSCKQTAAATRCSSSRSSSSSSQVDLRWMHLPPKLTSSLAAPTPLLLDEALPVADGGEKQRLAWDQTGADGFFKYMDVFVLRSGGYVPTCENS